MKDQAIQMAIAVLEAATADKPKEEPKKKGFKKLLLVSLVVLAVVAVSLILGLLIFRVRTPRFRLASVTVSDLSFTNTTTSASFDISLDAVYAVKNPNYAPFVYRATYVSFWYRGKRVGKGRVAEGRAAALSTKEEALVTMTLSSRAYSAGSDLGQDIGSGMVWLSVGSELRGQAEFIKVVKKDRVAEMSCIVVVNLVDKVVQSINCD